MLKTKKKFIFAIIAILLLISTTCLAATTSSEKAKFEIVENNICTININDIAKFEKKITSYDLEKKELTIELKVTNTAEPIFNKPTEITFVIDNSLSMKDAVGTSTRFDVITDSAKTLATKLMENENVKIGITTFSTGDEEGTLTDAKLRLKPSADKATVLSTIDSIKVAEFGPRTNIEAGLTIANQNFTKDCECKYIVLLTDGVPNTAVGGPTLTYSGETATKTIAKLKELDKAGVNIFSVMTGVPDVEEPSTGITYRALAEEIFGTTAEPTVGKFYYIPDSKIEETICTTILNNFEDTSSNTLTNLKIYDYFPQEIVDNFDFSYVTEPTKGTISPTIDLQNNLITWTIDKLEPKETATVSYKLKVKDNIDSKILNVILNTNEKVEITANEIKTDDGTNTLVSKVTPKVRLTQDTTTANTTIPQTGDTNTLYIFIGITLVAVIALGIRFYIINRDVK